MIFHHRSSRQLYVALSLLLAAPGVTAARAQTADNPADVALKLVAALQAHDDATAATLLVAASRADFIALMQASTRLAAAQQRLQERNAATFGDDATPVVRRNRTSNVDAVLRAEVARQTPVDRDAIELHLDLLTTRATAAQHVMWRAVKEDGTWKIALPACASPTEAAGMQRRMAELTRVTDDITTRIDSGAFGDSAEARIALVTAEQSVLPEPK